MAIKFSQLPKVPSISGTTLFPVVTIGAQSNALGVITGTVLSTYVSDLVASNLQVLTGNVTTINSTLVAHQVSLNSLTSGQSSQSSSIGLIQGQISVLQTNAASQAGEINSISATVLAGVVNSVLVTGPLVKSGNATYPNISMSVATTSANGYLSSTDWTIFNNKAPTNNPTFTGLLTSADATMQNVTLGNIVPSSNAVSNIGSSGYRFNTIFARATSAQYADLAEKYLPDAEYPVGTVVMIGGDAEVTACQPGRRAIGAISANPAYEMNSGLVGGVFVALKGRVPVFVAGPVVKGHDLVADTYTCGTAVMNSDHVGGIPFAVALETNQDPGIKLVEALIL
jgi:hypothetical protein